MQHRKPVIDTYKIVTFLVFVCAALFASLFVYHASQKEQTKVVTSNGKSVILPMGRELKPLKLVNANGNDFTERDLSNHWTLMFFGFTHCGSVCPITMEMISKAYPELHQAVPTLQVVLVSLDPERDDKATLSKYVKSFDPNFIGVSGKIEDVRKLQSKLGIYSAREEGSGSNYQLQHTSSIMLINPEGKWVGMFKFGMNAEEFSKEVKSGVTSLSHA
jgi:protein SCO1/2